MQAEKPMGKDKTVRVELERHETMLKSYGRVIDNHADGIEKSQALLQRTWVMALAIRKVLIKFSERVETARRRSLLMRWFFRKVPVLLTIVDFNAAMDEALEEVKEMMAAANAKRPPPPPNLAELVPPQPKAKADKH